MLMIYQLLWTRLFHLFMTVSKKKCQVWKFSFYCIIIFPVGKCRLQQLQLSNLITYCTTTTHRRQNRHMAVLCGWLTQQTDRVYKHRGKCLVILAKKHLKVNVLVKSNTATYLQHASRKLRK